MKSHEPDPAADRDDALAPAERARAEALAEALASSNTQPRAGAEEAARLAQLGRSVAAQLRARDASEDTSALAERIVARLADRPPLVAPARARPSALLRLVRGPVLLRVVAASLVAHLVALPVLAWYTLKAPARPTFVLRIEPPDEAAPFADPLPLPALGPIGAWESWQRQRLERYSLERLAAAADARAPRPSADERAHAGGHGGWSAAWLARLEVWRAPDGEAALAIAAAAQRRADAEPAPPREQPLVDALVLGARLDASLRAGDEDGLAALAGELAALDLSSELGARLAARAHALGLVERPLGVPAPVPGALGEDPPREVARALASDLDQRSLDAGPWSALRAR